MKKYNAEILKSAKVDLTPDYSAIEKFTLRKFAPEELYTFSVILCDNEIDRDFERFDVTALQKLAEIFVGKTGIFDHVPKGENQNARIYSCSVETDSSKFTKTGEIYQYLRGNAYMVKSTKNSDLILDIEAGIKKEVSISCNVAASICSICGNDRKKSPCKHIGGKKYENKLCYYSLLEPLDGYEWSFVAIPAQPNAGVIKKFRQMEVLSLNNIQKLFDNDEDIVITKEQKAVINLEIKELSSLAELGKSYHEQLKKDVVALAALSDFQIENKTFSDICSKLNSGELIAFQSAFSKSLNNHNHISPLVQLAGDISNSSSRSHNGEFTI